VVFAFSIQMCDAQCRINLYAGGSIGEAGTASQLHWNQKMMAVTAISDPRGTSDCTNPPFSRCDMRWTEPAHEIAGDQPLNRTVAPLNQQSALFVHAAQYALDQPVSITENNRLI
jgi:hypothetical protein